MIMTIFSEICLSATYNFTLIIGYYDKIEDYSNIEKRKFCGYLILFSMLGIF